MPCTLRTPWLISSVALLFLVIGGWSNLWADTSAGPQCGISVLNDLVAKPTAGLCSVGVSSAVEGPISWVGQTAKGTPIGAGKWLWSCTAASTTIPCIGSAGKIPGNGPPVDALGDIGKTSYVTLPFQDAIFSPCRGCSAGLEPLQLFASDNESSYFWDSNGTNTMQYNRSLVAQTEAAGLVVPDATEQRWQDTWVSSFATDVATIEGNGKQMAVPASLKAGVDADRKSGNFPNLPEFVSSRDFYADHPQYWDVAYNGGTLPVGWQSWNGQWGFISPLTPLDAVDCPPDESSCTWGDSYAYRQGVVATMSGGYGIGLSDFSDSFPYGASNQQDFNSRIIAAFAAYYGLSIPSGTTQEQALWIMANAYNQWDNYLSLGYGKFFGALATRITTATGRQALVIDQCQGSPLFDRPKGSDMRVLATQIAPKNFICTNQNQALAGNDLQNSIMVEVAGVALSAAYEPRMRQGANLEADDSVFWSYLKSSYPTLNAADQTQLGYRLLKRVWIWSSWAHMADRSGDVRRVLAYASRDYWDDGTLTSTQLQGLQTLVQGIVPSRPFGPAIYYSASTMLAAEAYFAKTWGVNGNLESVAIEQRALEAFVDSGGPVGYYVSDAALNEIKAGGTNAPSAWIVLQDVTGEDGLKYVSAAELTKLKAIAPVVDAPLQYNVNSGATAVAGFNALTNQPLSFTTASGERPISQSCASLGFPSSVLSETALTGFGFYDSANTLIVVVSNPSPCPDAVALSGTMKLQRIMAGSALATGTYVAKNLFTGASSSFKVTDGVANLSVDVARWDTVAYSITPAG